MITVADKALFQETVWEYYRQHGRAGLPWRQPRGDGSFDAYAIVVSELMLQQTQVARVIPKFEAFMARFPTVDALASAPLAAVITAWSGLGYNRRAKFLWLAAQAVRDVHAGMVPDSHDALVALPGIGPNTAGAVLAYAYNQPVIFVETNIRTVFIHHFFTGSSAVSDKELLPLLAQTLPPHEAREWYWALMDYGSFLKQTVGNTSRASAHYSRQSVFAGSRRQIRGQVLRILTAGPHPIRDLHAMLPDDRLESVLEDLAGEGLIRCTARTCQLAD